MKKVVAIVLGILLVLGALAVGAYFLFIKSDPEPRAAIEKTKVVDRGTAPADGTYSIDPGATDGFVGYRVGENLAGLDQTSTGRTSDVEGSLTIRGQTVDEVTITADLRTLESDRDMRDNRIRTDGLESDRFPEATFVLTEPIQLDAAPEAGTTVKATAVGDFTLHGVTNAVEIPVEGRWDGKQVQVVGSLPILFADYGMEPIDIAGFVSTDDHGEMEFQLFFAPT
jgi:polyisoprenoid-binding protein YceI